MTYKYNKRAAELNVFISAHKSNKFSLLLNGVDTTQSTRMEASLFRKRANAFEPIKRTEASHAKDMEQFWNASQNLVHIFDKHKVFVKLAESASTGFSISIKNIKFLN